MNEEQKQELKRRLTSRKLWGAVVFTIITIVLLTQGLFTGPDAVTMLQTIFITYVAGNAASKYAERLTNKIRTKT